MSQPATRLEHDLLGDKAVPAEAYYGVQTARALDNEILSGIEKACEELIAGRLDDEFRLDVFQGGAGTSTNMNANEVIANRALELMGHQKGEYRYCDPPQRFFEEYRNHRAHLNRP